MSDIVRSENKSWAQMLIDRTKSEIANAPPASPAACVSAMGSCAVEYAEAAAAGALLGATHAKWGLDSPGGPIDGLIAALGAAFGVAAAGYFPEAAAHARRVGSQAFTVLSFRRAYELVAHAPLDGGTASGVQRITLPARPGKGPGVAGIDPIEAVARALG